MKGVGDLRPLFFQVTTDPGTRDPRYGFLF